MIRKLPPNTVLVSSNARTWHKPTKASQPVRYCKLENGRYLRMHQNPHSTGQTPVTEAHIKHMADERIYG